MNFRDRRRQRRFASVSQPISRSLLALLLVTGAASVANHAVSAQNALGSPLPAASDDPDLNADDTPGGTPGTPSQPHAGPTVVPIGPRPAGSVAPGSPPVGAPSPPPMTSQPAGAPLSVSPSPANVVLGGTVTLHLSNALAPVTTRLYDDRLGATVDPRGENVVVTGVKSGLSAIDVTDARGATKSVAIRVAQLAGSVGGSASLRLTGDPASNAYVKGEIIAAASSLTVPRPGADVFIDPDDIPLRNDLAQNQTLDLDLPVFLQGEDFFDVSGRVHVHVENVALPRIEPSSLLVSDYPEALTENGVLYTADLHAGQADRFLYYHFNPPKQPDRKIVLFAQNPSDHTVLVQMIEGGAGPNPNEMRVGHLSTQRFLVHEVQNEGYLIGIPPHTVMPLSERGLPAGDIISSIIQLRQINGDSLHLTLVALNASDPVQAPAPDSPLLVGGKPHARGVYSIPEFFQDYTYRTNQDTLMVTIGQIPIPNLMRGEALAGDYGVRQTITVRMVNVSPHDAAHLALYASPRGGGATGTFLIDRSLVQAHSMNAYDYYKLREYTVPPASVIRTEIVTMPEAGSSYPLQLIVGPNDGSAPPGSPESIVY